MRVLVTGGLGFVGNAVTHVLHDAGHQVSVLTHTSRPQASLPAAVQLLHGDLRDLHALRRQLGGRGIEAVCHLAGLARVRDSFKRPLDYFDVNVSGTANLVRALSEASPVAPTIVFASTGAVYGSHAEGKLTEDLPAAPDTPYAASKRAAEQLLEYQAGTGAIGATVLRCFAISGAYKGVGDQDTTRIIPRALQVAAGLVPSIAINGDGNAVREFTHVLDIADAYRRAVEATAQGKFSCYNVGTGSSVTMNDVATAVAAITGRPVPIERNPPRAEPHVLVADSSQLRRDLGWSTPNSSLERILQDSWRAALTPRE